MKKGLAFRKKRKRRQDKAALKYGAKAKPSHRSPSGRSGAIHRKQRKAKMLEGKP